MADTREKLQNALCSYTMETLRHILTVITFCKNSSEWMFSREEELNSVKDIKNRMDQLIKVPDLRKKDFLKHLKNLATPVGNLEKELTEVLRDTLKGLNELDCFLDAVEKLAVTSQHVFMENELLRLPEDVTLDNLQNVLLAAASISPLLLAFKYENEKLFLPELKHVEVLEWKLQKYIQTTKTICEKLEKSCSCDFSLEKTSNIKVNVPNSLSEDYVQRMLDHITLLDEIRMDQHFRMVFLFQQETGQHFVEEFTERQPRMLEFLQKLEEITVQLSKMHIGAKISRVAGKSVGLVGGVLSIVGLALTPLTLGASLALTITGAGLTFTSGVNNAVTTATEFGVNTAQEKKAEELIQNFMKHFQSLQDCVDAQEGKLGQSIPKMASDVPDFGKVAAQPLALKTAEYGLSAVNGLFDGGLNIVFLCKESVSLAKGSQSEVVKFIKERVEQWKSVMGSWQKIHDSLIEGRPAAEKKKAILNMKIKDLAPPIHFSTTDIIVLLLLWLFFLFCFVYV